jgi:Zn-dependent peptidase ImmA (M78 family)/DNA-binding XRE family transcriptional regulator
MVDDAALGARLQAARRAIGLTQTEVGKELGMVTSTISAIEAGKRSVSGPELYRFAQIYKRPLAFFFSADPPTESPGFQYLFRQANEGVVDRPNIVKLEQLAADYQLIEELVDAEPLPLPPDYSGFGFSSTEDAETLAEMERSRLGLGDAPIKDLADLLDGQAGVRTFMLPVVNQRWSGLVVRDQRGRPCIAVNSKEDPYRRNFDLAHEYSHALVHLGRADRPDGHVDAIPELTSRATAGERFVEAFAAAFLMPKRAVLDQLERALRASGGQFTDEDLVRLAMHFGVSGQAMSLRLVALRTLARSVHDEYWKRASSFKALAEMLGYQVEDPPTFWEAPVILPKRYRYLAFKAYEREIISVSKLAELLREDLFEVRGKLEAVNDIPDTAVNAT